MQMTDFLHLEYLNIDQACRNFHIDEIQLTSFIKTNNIPVCVGINNLLNPLSGHFGNKDQINLLEEKYYYLSEEIYEKYQHKSKDELETMGPQVTLIKGPNEYDEKNEKKAKVLEFEYSVKDRKGFEFKVRFDEQGNILSDKHGNVFSGISPSPGHPKEISHNGFVELYDKSFIDSRQNINTIFTGKSAKILYVKCNKPGYSYRLSAICEITKNNLYIRQSDLGFLSSKNDSPQLNSDESFKINSQIISAPKNVENKLVENILNISISGNQNTKELKEAVKLMIAETLKSDPNAVLAGTILWKKLGTKKDDCRYKITSVTMNGGKPAIIKFKSGNEFDYKNATQHINEIISLIKNKK